jgi:SAM-dependent methyltransferase
VLKPLRSGFPGMSDYEQVLASPDFSQMRGFADNFRLSNERILGHYARQWVVDPLRQWSRQWEYPYVFSRVATRLQDGAAGRRILDAGSGITFFPFLIGNSFPGAYIQCVDLDSRLIPIYGGIRGGSPISFCRAGLSRLPFEDRSFDIIYSVSVLEHTEERLEIIGELSRILRPGGTLLLTFDVSLDGSRSISMEQAGILGDAIAESFVTSESGLQELRSKILGPELLTTHAAHRIDSQLLPWRLPRLIYRAQSLFRGCRFGAWPPLLTVCCLDLESPERGAIRGPQR